MLSLCSSSVDILRNLAAMASSTVSICTKHTPAAKLQALSKSCPLITAPRSCSCMCLGKGCRTAGKWRQKPGIRCQWFWSAEGKLSSGLARSTCAEGKGAQERDPGEKLGDLLPYGMVEDWKQDEEQVYEKLGLDLRWLKSELQVKNPPRKAWWWGRKYWDQGWRVGKWTEWATGCLYPGAVMDPSNLGLSPMHPRNHSQSEWLIPLKCCCAGRIASDTFCYLEWLRSAL